MHTTSCLCRAMRALPTLCAMLLSLIMLPAAQAHLMVAQRGTLNLVNNGAYMVMALPVDAFTGVDDNGDGLMSTDEMRAHSRDIAIQVEAGLQLLGDAGPRPLEGLLLNLSPDDNTPMAPAKHLAVMGRFALADVASSASGLKLRLGLFGKTAEAQRQEITITRGTEKQKMVLVPGREQRELLPSAWAVLVDNAMLGAEHVLSGLDHLLFLLVVLATGWGLRQIVLALTCFTLGHAITLTASALWGLSVPFSIVEPAIAATIIGMALFDRWSRSRLRPWPPAFRLGLIFACALIHGLGFAGALTDLGLDSNHRLLSLVGFNAGIEAGQLVVALLAGVVMFGIKRFKGASGLALTTRLASLMAIAAGSIWLVQRVVAAS
jgi:HupE / UreJ protein